jgi:hypothetical protein
MNRNYLTAALTGSIAMVMVTMPAVAASATLTQLFPALVGVELQPAQTAKLEQLSQQTLVQVKAVLTPAQVQQFDAALANGQSVRNAIKSLDLSQAQKSKLQGILKSNRSQLAQILTPQQQQQIAKNASALR